MKDFPISEDEKAITLSVVKKVNEHYNSEAPVITFKKLFRILTPEESKFVRRVCAVNPADYGFTGPYLGLEDVPKDVVTVDHNGTEITEDIDKNTLKYLPRNVFEAYRELNQNLFEATGKKLLITSGYRSPAYQAVTFLYYLNHHDYDFARTASGVAIPGYSEHGCPSHQAMDLMTQEGISSYNHPEDLPKTEEYQWMLKNAKEFGFYLSYPEDNDKGVIYEPWHWRYEEPNKI